MMVHNMEKKQLQKYLYLSSVINIIRKYFRFNEMLRPKTWETLKSKSDRISTLHMILPTDAFNYLKLFYNLYKY